MRTARRERAVGPASEAGTRPGQDPEGAEAMVCLRAVSKAYGAGENRVAAGLAIAMLAIEASASATAQAAALTRLPAALPGVSAHDQAQNRQATAVILGMALVYCFIAIANTMMIAARARNREVAALGLAGATRRQVLALVAAESALTVAIGAIAAAVAAAVVICGQHAALTRLASPAPVVIPWQPLSEITAACLTVAVTASVLSTARSLRKPLIELTGPHE